MPRIIIYKYMMAKLFIGHRSFHGKEYEAQRASVVVSSYGCDASVPVLWSRYCLLLAIAIAKSVKCCRVSLPLI